MYPVEGLDGIDKAPLSDLATGTATGYSVSNASRDAVASTVEAQAL